MFSTNLHSLSQQPLTLREKMQTRETPRAGLTFGAEQSGSGLPSGVPRSYVLFGAQPAASERERLARQKTATFEADFQRRTGFSLDPFQRESILTLSRGRSPVVAAPTSSGKTLVAEAAIDDAIRTGRRIFYTTPRKAISNEKYHEFADKYGPDNVGLVTGDVSVNPDAPLVLMTTEILRNMLYQPETNKAGLSKLKYVVFDECHFINDAQRGLVWEESALYARRELPNVQQIHLSATIKNASQYTDWLNSLNPTGSTAGQFELITSNERPVPLSIRYLAHDGHQVDVLDEQGEPTRAFTEAFRQSAKALKKRLKDPNRDRSLPLPAVFHPVFTVKRLSKAGQLPTIQFVFSRDRCEQYARQVLNAQLNLTTEAEKAEIGRIIDAYQHTYPTLQDSKLLPFLYEGVSYHHADMWPREKELVEVLLKKGLMKAVFATSTLAEGVNVPAQSVGMTSYEMAGEPVSESAFRQMTGRAGRRGMYERGYAILSHPFEGGMETLIQLAQAQPNEVNSQFRVTPYMALNHIARLREPARIYALLEDGFRAYQMKEKQAEQLNGLNRNRRKKMAGRFERMESPLVTEFKAMRRFLQAAGFVQQDNKLTALGQLASQIPMESSLIVAKAVASGALNTLPPYALAAVLSASVSEDKDDTIKLPNLSDASRDPEIARGLKQLDLAEKALNREAEAFGVSTDAKMGTDHIATVAAWCRTHQPDLLADSPGVLTYTILRTANLLLHISEAGHVSEQLRRNAREARQLLLGGIIQEQIRPKKVEIDWPDAAA